MEPHLVTVSVRIPPSPPDAIIRPGLIQVLEQGTREHRLLLLSAPAGYGKTTLLSQWARTAWCDIAWLSAGRTDNDPVSFLRQLLKAWERVEPDIIDSALGLLLGSSAPSIEASLAAFVSQAEERQDRIAFVVDDYHLIDDESTHQVLTYLVDQAPPEICFLLGTRSDPPLPLARYRARRQLLELRTEELQFSAEEAQELLARLIHPGRYRFVAGHPRTAKQRAARAVSDRFSVSYPNLDPGDRSRSVRIFNQLLARRHYFTSRGRRYEGATERAVMAFRKVNGMPRTYDADRRIFRRLAAGRGGFRLARPRAGRHVEVDISRQVMVLAAGGEARHIFHVSTGAPSTPSDPGRFRFYRREPGFNGHGMYYSVYYNGGEAIHGYHSVPGWAASHGCIRNPIPNSRFIYRWVRLGMRIYVHY
jgi:hypothetical protein